MSGLKPILAVRSRTLVLISLLLVALTLLWPGSTPFDTDGTCQAAGRDFVPQLAHWPVASRLEELGLEGPGLNSRDGNAICLFERTKLALHFPHAMQYLYRCLSFWRHSRPRQPVLHIVQPRYQNMLEALRYRVYQHRNRHNPFLEAFYEQLQAAWNVTIIDDTQQKHYSSTDLNHLLHNPPAVRIARHQNFQLLAGDAAAWRDTWGPVTACGPDVRLAILNRQTTRRLSNIPELHAALTHHTGRPVTVTQLEGQSLAQQVQFWTTHDIVISPHGAQLTGLAFLPDCAGVIELFPPFYWKADYFGSLAASAGLAHTHVYLGDANATRESVQHSSIHRHKRTRIRAREVDLCPAVEPVLRGVDVLLQAWTKCCQERGG